MMEENIEKFKHSKIIREFITEKQILYFRDKFFGYADIAGLNPYYKELCLRLAVDMNNLYSMMKNEDK